MLNLSIELLIFIKNSYLSSFSSFHFYPKFFHLVIYFLEHIQHNYNIWISCLSASIVVYSILLSFFFYFMINSYLFACWFYFFMWVLDILLKNYRDSLKLWIIFSCRKGKYFTSSWMLGVGLLPESNQEMSCLRLGFSSSECTSTSLFFIGCSPCMSQPKTWNIFQGPIFFVALNSNFYTPFLVRLMKTLLAFQILSCCFWTDKCLHRD